MNRSTIVLISVVGCLVPSAYHVLAFSTTLTFTCHRPLENHLPALSGQSAALSPSSSISMLRCLQGPVSTRDSSMHRRSSSRSSIIGSLPRVHASVTWKKNASSTRLGLSADSSAVPEKKGFIGRIKAAIPTAEERKKLIPLALMFFCILFSYTILRDTKDVLMVTAPKSGAEGMTVLLSLVYW